jgi:hypothetical protein
MPWRFMAAWRYSSTIHLDTSWRWVVSFMPLSLCPRGQRASYPLDRRQGGSRSRRHCCGTEKNLLDLSGNRNPAVNPVTCRYTDWLSRHFHTYDIPNVGFTLSSICRYFYRLVITFFIFNFSYDSWDGSGGRSRVRFPMRLLIFFFQLT